MATIPIFKLSVIMERLLFLPVKINTQYRTIYIVAKSKYLADREIVSVDRGKLMCFNSFYDFTE